MQILQDAGDRAGARGWLWRVERLERAGRRATIVSMTRAGEEGMRALTAIVPAEPLSRGAALDGGVHGLWRAVPMPAAIALVAEARALARRAFSVRSADRLVGDIHAWQFAAAALYALYPLYPPSHDPCAGHGSWRHAVVAPRGRRMARRRQRRAAAHGGRRRAVGRVGDDRAGAIGRRAEASRHGRSAGRRRPWLHASLLGRRHARVDRRRSAAGARGGAVGTSALDARAGSRVRRGRRGRAGARAAPRGTACRAARRGGSSKARRSSAPASPTAT